MPDGFTDTLTPSGPGADSDRGERIRLSDLSDVYLDKTLVLVGCGKAKRDPADPTDVHVASVGPDEEVHGYGYGETGPAWAAKDLYTSSYAAVKREFAETVTQWAGEPEKGWSVLSAEHAVVYPFTPLKYYDTKIDDLGGDETNPDHWVELTYPGRRPDGREIVTERDRWAADVAISLARWLADWRDPSEHAPWENDVNTLLVLAGQDYINPLRDRGVFEYGTSRMFGDPNHCWELPVNVRFLFEEIDAGGMFDQMAWLSDAVDRIEEAQPDVDAGEQQPLGAWTGLDRVCETCGVSDADAALTAFGEESYCEAHEPLGQCGRCGDWTHETGLGSYPLCPDCQTKSGGRKREPLVADPTGEQAGVDGWSE